MRYVAVLFLIGFSLIAASAMLEAQHPKAICPGGTCTPPWAKTLKPPVPPKVVKPAPGAWGPIEVKVPHDAKLTIKIEKADGETTTWVAGPTPPLAPGENLIFSQPFILRIQLPNGKMSPDWSHPSGYTYLKDQSDVK